MKIRDRITELRRVKASELRPSPKNWRMHPQAQQDALRGVLAQVGIADALLVRELPDGSLEIVDGHLRADVDPEAEWPVLVLDVTEEEAALLLATVDPLADMAEVDAVKLESLLADVEAESVAVQTLLDGLAEDSGIADKSDESVELRQLDTQPPPPMTWVLVGLPTVRFGEIAADIDRLADIDGIVLETTANNG